MIVLQPVDDHYITVVFRLPAAIWADTILLVGDFNGLSKMPMRQGELYWEIQLTLEAGKTYAYAYLVDGVDWRTEACTDRMDLDPAPPIVFVPMAIERLKRGMAG